MRSGVRQFRSRHDCASPQRSQLRRRLPVTCHDKGLAALDSTQDRAASLRSSRCVMVSLTGDQSSVRVAGPASRIHMPFCPQRGCSELRGSAHCDSLRPVSELQDLLNLQHGVLSRQQALRHGVTYGAVKARVAKGIWQRVHYGVYVTFSGELTRQSLLWAGVLRAGAGAVLSHETAAELNGLTDRTSEPIHVAIPRERRVTRVPGVAVHVSVRAEESRHPVLLPPRTRVEDTALDLVEAATSLDEALSWLARSCGRRLTTAQRLLDAMRGRTRMRWRRELQYALSDVGSGAHSVLELRYVRDVERAHGLPRGTRQAPAARGNRKQWDDVDYPQQGTIVELDGRRGHVTKAPGATCTVITTASSKAGWS